MKAFETWKYKGIRYIGIPYNNNYYILDEKSNSYGSWITVQGFRDDQQAEKMMLTVGKTRLGIIAINN